MPEELINIVDEHNEPTGEVAERKEAHERGLWHRTAHVYFYRVAGGKIELLAHLRSSHKDSNPNKWDTRFGGHVKAGRSIMEGAIDETREEVGIAVGESDLLEGDWEASHTRKHHIKNYFYNFAGEIKDLHFSDGEVQEAKWMRLDDIAAALLKHPENWTQAPKSFAEVAAFLGQWADK